MQIVAAETPVGRKNFGDPEFAEMLAKIANEDEVSSLFRKHFAQHIACLASFTGFATPEWVQSLFTKQFAQNLVSFVSFAILGTLTIVARNLTEILAID